MTVNTLLAVMGFGLLVLSMALRFLWDRNPEGSL